MVDHFDKAKEEFFSEAQELVESLSRNLLALDESSKAGSVDPSTVNEAFRAVHTLKGLAGLFGANTLGKVAHRLEDMLDDLRLGRLELSQEALDLLFAAVDVFGKLLSSERGGKADEGAADAFIRSLASVKQGPEEAAPAAVPEYELDPSVLAVLTEYEEHRLTTNIRAGVNLYRLRVDFDLASIDKALEETKDRAKQYGEIITYLPTGEASSVERIQLDILLASNENLETIADALAGDEVEVEEVQRKQPLPPAPSIQKTSPSMGLRSQTLPPERRVSEIPNPKESADSPGHLITGSLRSLSQTVRVDIRRLDHLMNLVGELSIVRVSLSRMSERLRSEGQRKLGLELQRLERAFDRRLSEMQDGILDVRMVPLGQIFDRLARVARQISRDRGKEIRLVITGSETEIDKLIVEELSDPLMHMIRNAIDHGIEAAEKRAELHKPAVGTIALNAYQKGNHVVLEIEDDGRGIDTEKLVARAITMGVLAASDEQSLTVEEKLALVFAPGLSTRDAADNYSGRGVGMDVVKTNISKLGGIIDVESEVQIGTKVTVTLPITLAIVSALLVRVSGNVFAVPLSSVSEALVLHEREVRRIDGREILTLRGRSLPIMRLAEVFSLNTASAFDRRYVVVASLGSRRLGLVVDHLIGQQDIVIKPLGKSLDSVRGFAGATELGDQRVSLVLDAASLIDEAGTGDTISFVGRMAHA